MISHFTPPFAKELKQRKLRDALRKNDRPWVAWVQGAWRVQNTEADREMIDELCSKAAWGQKLEKLLRQHAAGPGSGARSSRQPSLENICIMTRESMGAPARPGWFELRSRRAMSAVGFPLSACRVMRGAPSPANGAAETPPCGCIAALSGGVKTFPCCAAKGGPCTALVIPRRWAQEAEPTWDWSAGLKHFSRETAASTTICL